MNSRNRFIFCLSLIFALPFLSYGQSQLANGSVVVTATDPAGAVMAGVVVKLLNKDTGFSRSVLTNEDGRGVAALLPLGAYEITAQKPGFSIVRINDLQLQVGEQRAINIGMQVSAISETVTVNGGEADLVESERSNSASRLNDRAVHNLPILARNFQTFMLLSPGTLVVNRTGNDANFSIGGQKGIYTNYSLDGADYSSSFYGGVSGGDRSPFTISLEAIKEFVVLSNGFNAEFGRSGGGVMNAVTKSGTNQLHGNGFWYFQDHSFVADNAFGQQPLGRRSQFGATVGGPIKKDKLFFFAASDNQRRNTPINLVFNAQSTLLDAANSSDPARKAAAQAFLTRQKQILATDDVTSELGKLDWNISTKNTLSARYNRARDTVDNGTYGLLPQQARSTDTFGAEIDSTDAFSGQLTTLLSTKVLNEFRVSGTREDRPRVPHEPAVLKEVVNGFAGGAGVTVTGVGSIGNATFLPIGSLEWRYQVTNNLSYTFGRHSVKIGGDVNLINFDNLYRGNAPGVYTFFSFDNFVAKKPDQYAQFFGSGQKTTHPKYFAIYAQDTFKLKPGLTLNYGLRWEGQANPENDLPNTDFLQGTKKIPNDMKQFSPRLGIAWDPKSDGKNVFRAFAGYLYAPTPSLIWANVLRQNGDVSNGVNYLGTTAATIPAFNFPYEGPYPTPFPSYPGNLPVTTGTVPGGQVNMVANGFRNPRIMRTNAAYERVLISDMTVTITYDRYFSTGIERRKDLNLPVGVVQAATGRIIYDRSVRPYPGFGQVIQRENSATSRYNAVTLTLNKRFSHRFQAQASYTNGHNYSQDDNENNCCGNSGSDQQHYNLDWSRSNLDIRHNVVMNAVVLLPKGVEVSPILRFQSGRPFDATTGNDGVTAYVLSPAALANFQQYIGKPNAVVFGGGNGDTTTTDRPIVDGKLLPRNNFEHPQYFRTDVRAAKTVRFTETMNLKISVDILNLFKNSNKFTTNTQISSPSFGLLNNADEPFSIQTGLRFTF
jgi:hypothetical protein